MSFFEPPRLIEADVFAAVPDRLRKGGAPSSWIDANHPGSKLDCFLEGPAFDREGNLYLVDIPYGRSLRRSPKGEFDVAAEYDGWPNGIAIHRDGSIYITDYRRGILRCDPKTGRVEDFLTHNQSEGFKGVNDLTFARNGDLYFTDQGQTGLQNPTGCVYRLRNNGKLERIADNIPSPNGLVLNKAENTLFVAVTRANAVWRLPLLPDGTMTRMGVFIQMSGGRGPDGMAIDEDDGLAVAHPDMGAVWIFNHRGEPLYRVDSPGSDVVTNCAYGVKDPHTLYIVDSEGGAILSAELPTPGRKMYSQA